MVKLGNDWDELLKEEFEKEYYIKLREFLKTEYSCKTIYPDMYRIFEALKITSYGATKVVILGQDPYPGEKQAHGLAFSVQKGIAVPPSLSNIFKELNDDLGCHIPNNGYLEPWAKQGVLLLNASLTCVANMPNSHRNKGWEILTDTIIRHLNKKDAPVVYMLWGNNAKEKEKYLTNPRHLVLKSAHPSPLSAYYGFFGCQHFSKANSFLKQNGLTEIDWQIPNI